MKYRIGVATTDGIVVNQHFGRADRFLIVDVDENGESRLIEERSVLPVCEGGSHDEGKLEENVERLSDCQYILVSRIGQGAANTLEQRNIQVFEIPGMIEESIKKISAYVEIQNLLM